MAHVQTSEGFRLVGHFTFTKAKLETPAQWALHALIVLLRSLGLPHIRLVRVLNRICETEVTEEENLIVNAGRNIILDSLIGALSAISEIEINFTSIGDDNTAVTAGDTTLGNETFRKTIASATRGTSVMFLTAFYTAPEVSGTFEEFGIHIDGTGAADSGTLFSRVLATITKSITETLTIDYTVTVTAS